MELLFLIHFSVEELAGVLFLFHFRDTGDGENIKAVKNERRRRDSKEFAHHFARHFRLYHLHKED